MTEMQPTDGSTTRLARAMRECVAALLWAYVLVKLFIFAVDIYLLERFAPKFVWLVNVKAFILIGLIAVAWLVIGRRRLPHALLYIVAYPLIVLFWRVPKLAFRRWPLFIAFAPGIYRAISTFRTTYELYAVASICSIVIVTGSSKPLSLAATAGLAGFLVSHLYRSFRKAYSSSVFRAVSTLMTKLRDSVERGTFDSPQTAPQKHDSGTGAQPVAADPSSLYMLRSIADIVHSKIVSLVRGRSYDLYLIASWMYTVGLTAVVFAFEYLAISKLDSREFLSASAAGFWQFLGFSLGHLTPANVSPIVPCKAAAAFVCYCEGGCSILILVILFFTVLTAAREAFKDDLLQFATELDLIATAVDTRVTAVYRMTLAQAEYILLEKQGIMVNLLRKARGLPELPIPAPGQAISIVKRSE